MRKTSIYLAAMLATITLPSVAEEAQKEDLLPEVAVIATKEEVKADTEAYAGGQVTKGAQMGLLGTMDTLDTPLSFTGYTSETIQNQQARSVTDLMANDASIRTLSGADGSYDFFTIRGFQGTSASHSLNGLFGVLPAQNMALDGFERAEIIKGPTSLLFGTGPLGYAGGSTNFVPKRAMDTPLSRISADYYGDGQVGTRLDISRRYGDDNAFGIRFNGNVRDGATAVDRQSERLGLGVLALDYRGEKARVALDYGIQSYTIDNPTFGITITPGFKVPSAPDAGSNPFPNWSKAYSKDNYLILSGEYDLTPAWTAFGAIGRRDGDSYIANAYTNIDDAAGNTTVFPSFEPYKAHTSISTNAGLRGKFDTGDVSHQVAFAASLARYKTGFTFTQDDFSFISNIYHPTQTAIPPPFPGASKFAPKASEYEDTGFSLVDNIGFFKDKLQVILGARQQRFEVHSFDVFTGVPTTHFDEDKLSPSTGIVFKPQENISVYANYMEGISAAPTPPSSAANRTDVFSPIITKQSEAGVKVDWGRITTTFALFEIKQPNAFTDSVTNEFKVSGEQRNRGVEFSTFGEIASGVRLLGGVSYIDAEVTKSDQGSLDGKDAVGVPDWGVNIGGEWDIFDIPGLTLTGRAIYTDEQYVDDNNTQKIPSWTRWDMGARYTFKAFDKPAVARLNVLNVFDHDYWSSAFGSQLTLGTPRTLSLSTSFDF